MKAAEWCSHIRVAVVACVALALCGVIYLGYFCPERVCALTASAGGAQPPPPTQPRKLPPWLLVSSSSSSSTSLGQRAPLVFPPQLPPTDGMGQPLGHRGGLQVSGGSSSKFDIAGRDVLVFLHIQKTGGTSFGRHLVQDLDLPKPCDCRENRKRCKCTRPGSDASYWLFSRYSTGWQCGLHADWTELTNCVDSALDQRENMFGVERRYFYVTLLREPVQRFLSEFLHVQRGATWKQARHLCGGREPTPQELPSCFPDESWEGVQLDDFLSCPSNLAFNRQTRMLADLQLVACYNTSALPPHERDKIMLASAKENLRKMAFFGLCEQQQMSQYLFEQTFDMRFVTQFQQFNETHVASVLRDVTPPQLERIRALNKLDLELYEYARALLQLRFDVTRSNDPDFEEHFNNLGRLRKPEFKWEDIED